MFGKLRGLDFMYRRRRIESDEKKMINNGVFDSYMKKKNKNSVFL